MNPTYDHVRRSLLLKLHPFFMSKPRTVSETILPWLRVNLGKGCLGALTGTDARALRASIQIMELYSYHREPEILSAFGLVVAAMQPSTRYLAFHGIAHVMDWTDRIPLWRAAGLAPIENPGKCAYE